MASPVISFRNVYYAYPGTAGHTLKDVSFEVGDGRTLIILGGSGSGKSTILKLVLGLIKPESGSIEIEGTDISRLEERELMHVRGSIGMVFQEGALFDSLNVSENVGFRLREHSDLTESEFQERVDRMLGFVELGEYKERMPSDLSGGQRRRVAVARAMAHAPSLILYDEPTTGLDPIIGSTICDLIVKLRDLEGVTSVVVTHQLRDAFQVSQSYARERDGRVELHREDDLEKLDRTEFLVLNRGEIVFRGLQKELWTTKEPYVREFLDGQIQGYRQGAESRS